jgi:hypothetical protein
MTNWYGSNGKRAEDVSKPATQSMARPGDFPLGSIESRAAAWRKAEPVNYGDSSSALVSALGGM